MVIAAMKLKVTSLYVFIKKQRHYFANKGPSSQGYGLSCGHVWMWELDCEEGWAPIEEPGGLSHVWLFLTPWTIAHQAPLSMEFSRQEYWSR